jgi:hypothetical protein
MLSYTEHGKFQTPKQALAAKKGFDSPRSGTDFCEPSAVQVDHGTRMSAMVIAVGAVH